MNTRCIERDGVRFVECAGTIERIDDALELMTACVGHESHRLLIEASALPDAFFDLSTRFAGEFVQKLQNYRIRAAYVIPPSPDHTDAFLRFLLEARRATGFRAFADRGDAEEWLCAE